MKIKSSFNIVLVEPEIPQNTGNIVRLCACTNSKLFLIGKLGFSVDSRHLKRAGLDYWDSVDIKRIPTLEELQSQYPDKNFYYLTTKSKNVYTERNFTNGDFFVFGPETRGLDEELLKKMKIWLFIRHIELLKKNSAMAITIPMNEGQRSLNLSNSVAIVVYEAIRQNG